ncbi:MAG: sigma-70 family RNA polymerase sigma factor [Gemmataceae bacterium]|nr:sigma-70 family RNA polymerase sigma factor [Gemmataceae bacterium]
MPEPSDLRTDELQYWVAELRDGRPDEADPVLRKIIAKVGQQVRPMLRRFPRVGRRVDADDVLQGSLIRLLAALRSVRPESTRHFYALANALIRRELLDLTERYRRPDPVSLGDDAPEPAAPADADLDRLAWFHAAVERLPTEEREAVGLTYYHGWTQQQVADLFAVSVRTVQRWLVSATDTLRATAAAD